MNCGGIDKRCAFLTMEDTAGWSIDSDLAVEPLQTLGWTVEWVPWHRASVDWNAYRAVYIGTPWDYPQDPDSFLAVMATIDRSAAILVNDLSLVRWTISKTYLRDLEARGAAIVPSLWFDHFQAEGLGELFHRLSAERIIIKPVISTNATHTFLIGADQCAALLPQLTAAFAARPFVVQPFIENIRSEGEYSLFYFANEFSHAILKAPKKGDFRVQEEHGAAISAVVPDPELLQTAGRVLSVVEPAPVYARCDLVRGPEQSFLLMELELIEPSMYLRMNTAAPGRFAHAFDRYVSDAMVGSGLRGVRAEFPAEIGSDPSHSFIRAGPET